MKTCSKCGETKELEEFAKNKGSKDGRATQCKQCKKRYDDSRRFPRTETGTKTCSRCGDIKDVSEFSTDRGNPDGLFAWCRPCSVRSASDWNRRNRDRFNEYLRGRYRGDYERNPEKYRARNQLRRSRRNHPDAPQEKFVDIEVFERDKWTCQLCSDPVDRDLKYPDPMSPSLDHIVPVSHEEYVNHGHTRSNTQLAHLRCNLVKNNKYHLDS